MKTLRQSVTFKAAPGVIYEMLMDDQIEPIKEDWKEHYWDKMKALLEAEA